MLVYGVFWVYSTIQFIQVSFFFSFLDMLIPYKFDFLSCDGDVNDISNLILTAQDLATSYSSYQNRVDLNSIYRSLTGITCLDKVMYSFVQKMQVFW